jgi:hypothetical protein
MQILFFLPNIQQKILNFDVSKLEEKLDEDKTMDKADKVKLEYSRRLITNLQRLFASMMLTNVKYLDPGAVLNSVVDDNGQKLPVHQ